MSEDSAPGASRPTAPAATVDIVIPVLNEAHVLAQSVATLRAFLQHHPQCRWRIVIADNGSTDGTLEVAQELSRRHPEVGYIHLGQRGRGRALRRAWTESAASVVCYMDVDLSTGLEALPPLIRAITHEGYSVATGSRLKQGAQIKRSFKREVLSRGYNLLIKLLFWPQFSDAQCGFKAASRQVVVELVPLIQDQAWFFDTELLLLAERKGHRIKDIPVRWVEDPDSRVKLASTVWEDIKGLLRLRFRRL
ncbi:MAG: glycosyltransferase family 2 protein [Chloroflexi bacterium]|nr:glycosyltransferase family 2 protein [Chloroflexota bacterium]